ncbi:helix-turn-helix domain-containing protein [Corallibacter sp.]|uniref:helix-turn-helix domain-containing protein n=1 Tax=Corallibacter sp. TaxID=2038084 RepID=UPI003AB3EA50
MTLGDKLKRLRESKGLVQREVGAVIGLDGTFISQVERSKKPINRKHLKSLASFFSTDEAELQMLWLSDKIYHIIEKEKTAKKSIQNVLDRLN